MTSFKIGDLVVFRGDGRDSLPRSIFNGTSKSIFSKCDEKVVGKVVAISSLEKSVVGLDLGMPAFMGHSFEAHNFPVSLSFPRSGIWVHERRIQRYCPLIDYLEDQEGDCNDLI